jgi:hypothetical protein
MDKMMNISRIYRTWQSQRRQRAREARIEAYVRNGRTPWSDGYSEYKEDRIKDVIHSPQIMTEFASGTLPPGYGVALDERLVEYPWILNQLSDRKTRMLDAGSTFNFEYMVDHRKIAKKNLTIFTYAPEPNAFTTRGVSHVYGDLRATPFKDGYFEEIVSQSTIEHIDMDNSIYGYDVSNSAATGRKSYSYLAAVIELERILAKGGLLLLTFPYGAFESHGFFQQFDNEMTDRIICLLSTSGEVDLTFFRYRSAGWTFITRDECEDASSYNPHTGIGKGDDMAAHCRGICCISFRKST